MAAWWKMVSMILLVPQRPVNESTLHAQKLINPTIVLITQAVQAELFHTL